MAEKCSLHPEVINGNLLCLLQMSCVLSTTRGNLELNNMLLVVVFLIKLIINVLLQNKTDTGSSDVLHRNLRASSFDALAIFARCHYKS